MTVPPVEPLIDYIFDWGEDRSIVHDGNREEKRARVVEKLGQENQRKVRKASLYAMNTPYGQQEEREAISRSLSGNADSFQTYGKNPDWIFGIEIDKILTTGDVGREGNGSGYAIDQSAGAILSRNSSGKGCGHHAASSTTNNEDSDEDNGIQGKQSECSADEVEAIKPDHNGDGTSHALAVNEGASATNFSGSTATFHSAVVQPLLNHLRAARHENTSAPISPDCSGHDYSAAIEKALDQLGARHCKCVRHAFSSDDVVPQCARSAIKVLARSPIVIPFFHAPLSRSALALYAQVPFNQGCNIIDEHWDQPVLVGLFRRWQRDIGASANWRTDDCDARGCVLGFWRQHPRHTEAFER